MKKVDFGMRCQKCNKKISDRVLGGENGSRIEKSGVCQSCHDEFLGMIKLELEPGTSTYQLKWFDCVITKNGSYDPRGLPTLVKRSN